MKITLAQVVQVISLAALCLAVLCELKYLGWFQF